MRNKFDWNRYCPEMREYFRDHIEKNPYDCDECGDRYNKGDLYKTFPKHLICRNCIDEYSRKLGD